MGVDGIKTKTRAGASAGPADSKKIAAAKSLPALEPAAKKPADGFGLAKKKLVLMTGGYGNGVGSAMWNNWNTSYERGISPKDAGPKVVKDMADSNRQMLMAFASALANAQTPGKGFKGVVEMGNEVLGVVKDKGDLIEAAYDQEYGAKTKKKVD